MKNGMHVDEYGHKMWYLHGQYHREDGPAVILATGSKVWYLNGKRHREDGPAVEWGNSFKQWWLNDVCYSFDDWLEKLNIPDEDKLILTLKWA